MQYDILKNTPILNLQSVITIVVFVCTLLLFRGDLANQHSKNPVLQNSIGALFFKYNNL